MKFEGEPLKPLAFKDDQFAVRKAILSLSRLGRALVELIALTCDEVSVTPLQKAIKELNITPRMAHEYPLGDIQAELEELTEEGWLIDLGGAYRCHPELIPMIVDLINTQSIKIYKRQVIKLCPSALQHAIRAQMNEGGEILPMHTLKVGRQIQRDLMIAEKLDDQSGMFSILWGGFESELLPRLWIAQCLRSIESSFLERLPSSLSTWINAELILSYLYQRPDPEHREAIPLYELEKMMRKIEQECTSNFSNTLSELSAHLIDFMKLERVGLGGRQRIQTRSAIQTCLESITECLMLIALLHNVPQKVHKYFKILSEHFEELKSQRSLSQELNRRDLDPTGRLRLWSCLAHLMKGDVPNAQIVWSDGVRAFNRQSVGRLLGADAHLTRRISALCLFALKSPSVGFLKLPSTALLHIDIEEKEGSFIDDLINLLPQPDQGITPVRQNSLRLLCSFPHSPLWELVALTALAWGGITDQELELHENNLSSRLMLWKSLGFIALVDAITCLKSTSAPTHLSGLKEPSPEWLQRLEHLEELTELLVQAYAQQTHS